MNNQETLRTLPLSVSAAGDNTVLSPGVTPGMPAAWDNPGTYIAIDFISFVPGATTTVTLESGTAAEGQTALTGPMALQTAQTLTWENAIRNVGGILKLAPNRSFVINNSGAVQLSGLIRYRIVNGE